MQKARKLRTISAAQPDKSFQVFKDPRYLQNARELARRAQGGTRVIGGKPVRQGEFLDCVAVGSDAQWGCSGTLIGPNVVLTAGHCADFATRVFFGNDVKKVGKVVAVKQRVRHPEYRRGKHNDLMVLILQERVETVEPRKMASKSLIDKATDGRIIGFGHVDPNGLFGYGIKRMVDVPIVSSNCRGKIDGEDDNLSYGCDRGLEIVAGRPLLERDSCKGDSGGPFYILDGAGEWLIAGATSRATDSAMHTCGDGGIYVRVDRYRNWIESIPGAELA
jgi:secreted trypsin-like serine protease